MPSWEGEGAAGVRSSLDVAAALWHAVGLDYDDQRRLPGGGLVVQVAARGAEDDGEGDAVGVQRFAGRGVEAGTGGAGALGLQLLVGDEESVDLLGDAVGVFGPQEVLSVALEDFGLEQAGLAVPPVCVGGGDVLGWGFARVQQAGDHSQGAGAGFSEFGCRGDVCVHDPHCDTVGVA